MSTITDMDTPSSSAASAQYTRTPAASNLSTLQSSAAQWSDSMAKTQKTNVFLPPPRSPSRLSEAPDLIDNGVISLDLAGKLVAGTPSLVLQHFSSNFPFVLLDPQEPLHVLRQNRPFLLLAVLALTSNVNIRLQETIERELRETLSREVIMNGQKSLDLLQGILVYVACRDDGDRPWLLQTRTTNAGIFGCYELRDVDSETAGGEESLSGVLLSIFEVPYPFQLLPKTRLTSAFSLSIVFRKPVRMKYSNYMDDCCQLLAEANIAATDHLLSCFTHLQELAGDISDNFDHDGYLQLAPLSAMRIDLLVKSFRKRLNQLGVNYINDINSSNVLLMFYNYLNIYLHEIALHAPNPLNYETSTVSSCDSWYLSAARSDALLCSLEATKSFLDRYLRLSPEERFRETLAQTAQVIYATLTLGQFARGIDTPLLDAEQLRFMSNVKYYLDALGEGLGAIIAKQGGREESGFFWYYQRVFEQARWWAESLLEKDGPPGEAEDKGVSFIARPINMDLMQITDILRLSPPPPSRLPQSSRAPPPPPPPQPHPHPPSLSHPPLSSRLDGSFPTNVSQAPLNIGPSDEGWIDLVSDWPQPPTDPSLLWFSDPNRQL
ncbi:MAG: hypothetical protein M1818_002329 [Claussenomyces sp. TS43310]|nr:MAG: hypothetical protein M1818_002329 [Claussenomyces sp. TS43310]